MTQAVIDTKRREALAALQLWQTFEYLSPQSPPEPKEAPLDCAWALDPTADDDSLMPWRHRARKETMDQLFKEARNFRFQLFAGIVRGDDFIGQARDLLDAPRLDLSEQKTPDDAATVVIPLDRDGRVNGDVFISAVPWAMRCIALAQNERRRDPSRLFDFSGFFGLTGVERQIKNEVRALLLRRQLIVEDADRQQAGDPTRTLLPDDVRAVEQLVFESCGWHPTETGGWIIKAEATGEEGRPRQAEDPLNSFFAEDLERIQPEYAKGRTGQALTTYLEMQAHKQRVDIEQDLDALIAGVHPERMPATAWPGQHGLVTAQQFAVNALMETLSDGGLFSVNGPPGTGKSTMLKDILAAVVGDRANALAAFDDPLDAFGGPLRIEDDPTDPAFGVAQRLHPTLRGFGLVVACNGNVAAENISLELPGRKTIDPGLSASYLAEVANSMGLSDSALYRKDTSWGLVSAPLGNSTNRSAFTYRFWFGPSKAQAERDAKARKKEARQYQDGTDDPMRPLTLQNWVKTFGPRVPRWQNARKRFLAARAIVDQLTLESSELASKQAQAQSLARESTHWGTQRKTLSDRLTDTQQRLAIAKPAAESAVHAATEADIDAKLITAMHQRACDKQADDARLAELEAAAPRDSTAIDTDKADKDRAHARIVAELSALRPPGAWATFFKTQVWKTWDAQTRKRLDESEALRKNLEALDEEARAEATWRTAHAELALACAGHRQALRTMLEEMAGRHLAPQDTPQAAEVRADTAAQAARTARALVDRIESETLSLHQALRDGDTRDAARRRVIVQLEVELAGEGISPTGADGWRLRSIPRERLHRAAPYERQALFNARRELFLAAMALHESFIVHAWRKLRPTLNAMMLMLSGQISPNKVDGGPMALWDALFLVVPLISTTFASFPRLFRGIGKEELAWVLIDEAGQAAPQSCVGALWRAKRAVVVGDPIQLEPVVGVPRELTTPLLECCGAAPHYLPPRASAQTMADHVNRFGTHLNAGEGSTLWLGSPLVVHRRCQDPMFSISNAIAYDGRMVHGVGKAATEDANGGSRWIHVPAEGAEEHWIRAQGMEAMSLMRELVGDEPLDGVDQPRLYVVTPFKSVAEKMRNLIRKETGWPWRTVERICGTVHTFQGKEAPDVIFLLGGNPASPGVISKFAGASPNLVNVAVTRAKARLFVIGDRDFWLGPHDSRGYYRTMADMLDRHAGVAAQ